VLKPDETDLQIARSVEVALWLAFAGSLGRLILHNHDLVRRVICRPMLDAAGCILILQGILALLEEKRNRANTVHLVTYLVLFISLFELAQGLVSGAKLQLWFQMGLIGFGTGFAVFLAGRPLVFETVLRALRQQIVFADIFVGYLLLHWPKESRTDWYWTGQNNEGLGAVANHCFFSLPFLIANYRRLGSWQLFLVGVGFAEYLALNLIGENRSAIIIAFIVIPALLIGIALRQGQTLRWAWKTTLCAGIVLIVLFYAGSGNEDFALVMRRFGIADISTAHTSEIASQINLTIWDDFAGSGRRSEELRELLSDTSWTQLFFGRGFGVSWYAPLWAGQFSDDWYIVHFGPGYMLLVGGLPLAICFTSLLSLAIWKAWVNVTYVPSAAGALIFLSAATVNYLQHGVLLDEPEFYLLWLCIGFSVGACELCWSKQELVPATTKCV
jgi:hypothetical protein